MNDKLVEEIVKKTLSEIWNNPNLSEKDQEVKLTKEFIEIFTKEIAIRCAIIANKCQGTREVAPGTRILSEFGLV